MTVQTREILKDVGTSHILPRIWNTRKRWLVLRGGTRSSKTTTLTQMAISWLFFGYIREDQYIPSGTLAVVRKYKSTLKATVMRDFESMLDQLDLKYLVDINRTARTFKFGDRMVEFVGADDEQKLRGFKANITWLNEGNELEWDKEVRQLRYRTSDLIIVDFNPSDPYVWINEELEQKRALTKKDVDIDVSTYKDNPFLEKYQIDEIEYTQEEDLNYWNVYGLGLYGEVKGLIFPNAEVVESMPRNLKKRFKCMDFGYSSAPTTLLECGIANGRDLYIDEYFYLKGMKANDIAVTFRALKIKKREKIFVDPANDLLIGEIQNRGYNIIGAEKGPGSVDYGIQLVNQFNLKITDRSINCIRERLKYRYKTDSSGVPTGVPIKGFDHTWDAVRYYSIMNLTPRRKISSTWRGAVA